MENNVTDLFGNRVEENKDKFDTYKVNFLDGDDKEVSIEVSASPIITSVYVGFSRDPSSVEFLIPVTSLISMFKLNSSYDDTNTVN